MKGGRCKPTFTLKLFDENIKKDTNFKVRHAYVSEIQYSIGVQMQRYCNKIGTPAADLQHHCNKNTSFRLSVQMNMCDTVMHERAVATLRRAATSICAKVTHNCSSQCWLNNEDANVKVFINQVQTHILLKITCLAYKSRGDRIASRHGAAAKL